jgi:hypothetical protein
MAAPQFDWIPRSVLSAAPNTTDCGRHRSLAPICLCRRKIASKLACGRNRRADYLGDVSISPRTELNAHGRSGLSAPTVQYVDCMLQTILQPVCERRVVATLYRRLPRRKSSGHQIFGPRSFPTHFGIQSARRRLNRSFSASPEFALWRPGPAVASVCAVHQMNQSLTQNADVHVTTSRPSCALRWRTSK